MLLGKIDEATGTLESVPARLFVPGIVELVPVFGKPAGIPEHRRQNTADARFGKRVEPAFEGNRQIDDGGDAAEEELGERDPHRRDRSLGIVVEDGQELVKRTVPEAGAAALVGNALAQRLSGGMRVDVDEAGQQQALGAIDLGVGRLGIALAHENNVAAAHRHVEIAPIDMAGAGLIPGDDPGGIAKNGGVRHLRPTLAPVPQLLCRPDNSAGARRSLAPIVTCRSRLAKHLEAPDSAQADQEKVSLQAARRRAVRSAEVATHSRKAQSARDWTPSRRRTNSVSTCASDLGSLCMLTSALGLTRSTRLRGNSVMPRPAPTHLKMASTVPNSSRRGVCTPRRARTPSSRCR